MSSRDLEHHFLDILERMNENRGTLLCRFFSFSAPDMTIVFDELDKLGNSLVLEQPEQKNGQNGKQTVEHLRSLKIKQLLSDLKNLIDANNCRFILIGGRHMYDEWLADQTQRDQLLPSIFDKTIYLPSLLTDYEKYHPDLKDHVMLERIKQYVAEQYKRANRTSKEGGGIRLLIPLNKTKPQPANQWTTDCHKSLAFPDNVNGLTGVWLKERKLAGDQLVSKSLLDQFVKYLSYRSLGVPKRMNEIFSLYIKPLSRVIRHSTDKTQYHMGEKEIRPLNCADTLYFSPIDIYRIQFTARLYNRIEHRLGRKLYLRDDKLVMAIFSFTDYLFKFHNRAFDWTNMERFGDIEHMHREPDLRQVVREVIDAFAQFSTLPVLNGMYSFRFKSSVSAEVAYLSKLSREDSAAFNFTLAESQAVIELYQSLVADPATASPERFDALGELHEYDQAFESARKAYDSTIKMIDQQMASSMTEPSGEPKFELHAGYVDILDRLGRKDYGIDLPKGAFIVDWAIHRIRLMLKIGLTYEFVRDYERALAHYHDAHVLSRQFLCLLLEPRNNSNAIWSAFVRSTNGDNERDRTSHINAKQFNILFQSAYAIAWLVEKQGDGVETSLGKAREEIAFHERLLHHFCLSDHIDDLVKKAGEGNIIHARFGQIKAELYNKAGDLCFFKGCSFALDDLADATEMNTTGYLYRASSYYTTSLHYLRHYHLLSSGRIRGQI